MPRGRKLGQRFPQGYKKKAVQVTETAEENKAVEEPAKEHN